ncbi:MAG: folylpolyglutamate synthase/dihydrofolate synthase family protein [Acidobacteriota bacterium]
MNQAREDLHPLIAWLFGLRGPDLKWELDTARAFAALLGHPERRFPAVHVAGTNGKGSVAAMVEAIARRAGLRTGLFTSPHLVCPTERIRIDGAPLALDEFLARIGSLRRRVAEGLHAGRLPRHPSFFEMMTGAALDAFAEHRVDLAVVEVGLGGRLDATNVVCPAVSAITTIGLDHRKTLGGTLQAIAAEKAGIVRPGVPVVLGAVPAPAVDVIERIARRRGAPVHSAPHEVTVETHADGRLALRTPEAAYGPLRPGLAGDHQAGNAAVAVRVAELLRARCGIVLTPETIEQGLAGVRWPGRLERLDGTRPEVLLDAAHNVDGIRSLARHLGTLPRPAAPGRRALVFGLTEGRDPLEMLEPLARLVGAVVAAPPATSRAIAPARIVAAARRLGLEAAEASGARAALESARRIAGPTGEIVVAGSLYLVGDARRELLGLSGAGHPRRETVPPLADDRPRPARNT